ncbi:MAG: ferrous iron transport protein A [Deltaproteobacteria bacterium]|nr:ferrous iron transport protein A [Deltaproteobacteria bacterium]
MTTPSQNLLITLDSLLKGQRAIVASVCTENTALCRKLLSMGIVAGTAIEKICNAPLGDPAQFKALGYRISLRRSEAQSVQVTPL